MRENAFEPIVMIHIALNTILGGFFYKYSTSEEKYGSPDCVYLRFTSYVFSLFCLTGVISQLLIIALPFRNSERLHAYCLFSAIFSFIQITSLIFVFVTNCTIIRVHSWKMNHVVNQMILLGLSCFLCSLLVFPSFAQNWINAANDKQYN